MFHFSQAVYRKVQAAGLATAYLYEVSFTKFVRILCAISFLPLTEVASTVDELAEYVFTDIKSPDLQSKLEDFKLVYFRKQTIGNFHSLLNYFLLMAWDLGMKALIVESTPKCKYSPDSPDQWFGQGLIVDWKDYGMDTGMQRSSLWLVNNNLLQDKTI